MLQLSEHQSLQFQLSLFSNLVDYVGTDEPVKLVERMVKEASVFGNRDKKLSSQIAQYFVNRLNFRLFDWGCSCVLFSRRLVRVMGSDVDFTIARIVQHWLWQVEAFLSPERSIIREAAELVETVSNHRCRLSDEHWRAWAWDAILHSCLSNRTYQVDLEIYPHSTCSNSFLQPQQRVAEAPLMYEAIIRRSRIIPLFDLASVFHNAPSGQIIPIVKYSHHVPWVDELERMKKRSMCVQTLQRTAL